MKTFKQFILECLLEGMATQSTVDKPGFSSDADDIGPVAGRSPKMFFIGRKFVKTYSNGKSKAEKIWLDSFKKYQNL
jgi:hypothetical protein